MALLATIVIIIMVIVSNILRFWIHAVYEDVYILSLPTQYIHV
jgi:hypothetical protein